MPETVKVTNGKGPNVNFYVEYCLKCLKFFIDAAKSQFCKEDWGLSSILSAIYTGDVCSLVQSASG